MDEGSSAAMLAASAVFLPKVAERRHHRAMRLILLAPLSLTAYAAVAAPQERANGQGGTVPCYGSTKDWRAWIDATPGPQGPRLVVTPEIRLMIVVSI